MQLVDDMLDYTASSSALGKPALHDLQSGLATAPVLYAAERHPELRPLILRKFQVRALLDAAGCGEHAASARLAAACNLSYETAYRPDSWTSFAPVPSCVVT